MTEEKRKRPKMGSHEWWTEPMIKDPQKVKKIP